MEERRKEDDRVTGYALRVTVKMWAVSRGPEDREERSFCFARREEEKPGEEVNWADEEVEDVLSW